MIKCIATDMDGTLLGADQTISEENKKAILAAQEAGITVVISTGRSFDGASFPVNEASLNMPIICMNGAQTYTNKGEVLSSVGIPHHTYKEIMSILDAADCYYELYTSEGQFSTDMDKALSTIADIIFSSGKFTDYEEVLTGVKKRFVNSNIQFIDHYNTILEREAIEFYKVLAFSTDKEKLTTIENNLKNVHDIAVSSSGFENLEINSIHAQKGLAVERFVTSNGIQLAETMAIGDSYNDVSMLQKAGFAVAMGNAPDDIKALCHYVTATNVDNGFAEAVYKVIEMNKES
ncbi:Cof-type HAD-IIB family hydrolase [Caldibacillus lycopersici]|uniref:Cof-type HAD-IIB family hydrolase n=1 Tax=Perspicuibacillus lycopersici TaxID=1325689 RepID=A0AAE3IU49_9BACI|nr:Cof-type HAD-IIB family hydrolase [Perspicuibacillus lycopersici]MCU9614675.1 Cof-type HAD-IIB family hydrolase [Perspicuibacillus lycopersici]